MLFKERDRTTQAEILRQLREVLRQLVDLRASVEALTVTQAHILSRLPRPDDEMKARVDDIREDMTLIRKDALEDMLDQLDALMRRVRSEVTPMTFEEELAKAARTLSRRDPQLRPVIRNHGVPTFRPHDDYFTTLVDAIISQQISGRAAESIMRKLRDAVGAAFVPEAITRASDDVLRASGVSPQKLGYLRSLCRHVLDDQLDLAALPGQSNDAIINELTAVKGIGVWTAQMFLMFCVGRLDVLPTGDLGIQRGVQILYGMTELPKPRQIEELAERNRWAPYRTVASWYLWRSVP